MQHQGMNQLIAVDAVTSVLGGGVTFTSSLINEMASLRPSWQFHVYASTEGFFEQLSDLPNIHTHDTPCRTGLTRFIYRQTLLPVKIALLNADTIISQFPGIFLGGRRQIMLVLNSHYLMEPPVATGRLGRLRRRFQRLLFTIGYRLTRRSVFLSHQMQSLARPWVGLGSGKGSVVYEGVESPQGFGESAKAPDHPYFAAVGTINYHKNYPVMLRGFGHFCQVTENDVRLKIAGQFSQLEGYEAGHAPQPDLVKLCEQLGIADRVDWLGQVAGDDLWNLYRGALAFVSTSMLEAFPLTAIEAMGTGTPVIVPNTSSYPEVIADSGLYTAANDPKELGEQMKVIATEPETREQLAKKALRRAGRFSWQASAQQCIRIIEELQFSKK